MEIHVLEAKLQVSQTSKKEYTNIKTQSGYINVWGDHLAEKGKTITITEPEKFGKSLWARIDKTKPEPKPEPQKHIGITISDYERFVERLHPWVLSLEPNSPEARAQMIDTAVIAFSNGKIINESDEPSEDEPPGE
jgi:hypothetical protein